ncbi:MAG: D-alanyl-D-alanine carboxypeptidase family protein [Nocardioidaceae bacterium]
MGTPLFTSGRRRRRRRGRALIALLALLAVAVAAWVGLRRDRDDARPAPPVAAAGAARGSLHAPTAPARVGPAPPLSLARRDVVRPRLRQPPRVGLLFDLDTGRALWRRQPLRRLPVASLTKIMTALVVTQRTSPGERVRIPRRLRYTGSAIGMLPRGRRVGLEPLLTGLLLVSGNDAAVALALHVAGSQRRFVELMNERARGLGLRCTRFVSPHGLESGNRSCARDLAVMAMVAMKSRRIARITRRRYASFRFPIKGGRLFLTGHNPLIRTGYRGAIGLKTGYTSEAGPCFVGVARRGGRTLGVVLLDAPLLNGQARRLLDLGFGEGRRTPALP